MTDEDTLMGFSDGLSQSGIHHLVRLPVVNVEAAQNSHLASVPVIRSIETLLNCLLYASGVSRGGDDRLRSSDLHPTWGRGFCPACGQMALTAEEFLGWLLFHTGNPIGVRS